MSPQQWAMFIVCLMPIWVAIVLWAVVSAWYSLAEKLDSR